jgi:serine protease Do
MLMLATVLLVTTQAAAEPPRKIIVRLVNASRHTIHEVFASRSGTPNWGGNLLKSGPIRPGSRRVVRFAGDCGTYDLRFVAEKGTELLEDEIDFCDDDDVVTIGADGIDRRKPAPPR